jgi:hypothetical protein
MVKLNVEDTVGDLVDVAYLAFCDIADSCGSRDNGKLDFATDFFSCGGEFGYVELDLGRPFRLLVLQIHNLFKGLDRSDYGEHLFNRIILDELKYPSLDAKLRDFYSL